MIRLKYSFQCDVDIFTLEIYKKNMTNEFNIGYSDWKPSLIFLLSFYVFFGLFSAAHGQINVEKMTYKQHIEANVLFLVMPESGLNSASQKSLYERSRAILSELKKDFGVDEFGGLQLRITRKDLALIVGTVPESLVRVLADFKRECLWDLVSRKIIFLDPSKLQKRANV